MASISGAGLRPGDIPQMSANRAAASEAFAAPADGTSGPSLGIAGLSLQNPETIDALLLEVAAQREQQVDASRNTWFASIAARIGSALGVLRNNASSIQATADTITSLRTQAAEKQQVLSLKNVALEQDKQALDTATAKHGQAVTALEVANANLAAIDPQADPAGYAAALAARDSAQAVETAAASVLAAATSKVDDDNRSIDQLKTDIATLQTEIATTTARYNVLVGTYLDGFTQIKAALGGHSAMVGQLNLGRDQVTAQEFGKIFERLRALVEQAQVRELQRLDNQRVDNERAAVDRLALAGHDPNKAAVVTGSRLKIPV